MAIKVVNVRETFAKIEQRTIKALVAGDPGAGKTRSASTWPNVLYADVEGRLLSVRDRDVHSVRITSIANLEELRSDLAQRPDVREKMLGIPVGTIVLDTVDEIARMVIRERLRSEKAETMRMADWGYLGDTLRSLLRGFRDLDINVVLNVHLKSSEDSETGRVEHKPAIQGSVGEEIAAYVDEAFLLVARPTIDPQTGDRVLSRHFQTYPDSQHTWVKDHSGMLPLEFPINFNDDHTRLATHIFGEATKPDAVTAKAAVASVSASTPPGKIVSSYPERADGVRVPVANVPLPDEVPAAPAGNGEVPAAPEQPAAPGNGTAVPLCADCQTPIDNPDQVDISIARWKVPLCRADFAGRKTRKAAAR